MTINSFVLKGDLNGKIVVVRFFFCWVYILVETIPLEMDKCKSENKALVSEALALLIC